MTTPISVPGLTAEQRQDQAAPAPMDLLEKTISILLLKTAKSAEEKRDTHGESKLMAPARLDLETARKPIPTAEQIPRHATKAAVDTSVSLAAWFTRTHAFETTAHLLNSVVAPRPDPTKTFTEIGEDPFTQRPVVPAETRSSWCVKDDRCAVATFSMGHERLLLAANPLLRWNSAVPLADVRTLCPKEELSAVDANGVRGVRCCDHDGGLGGGEGG